MVAGATVGTTVALAGRDSSPAVAAGSGSVVAEQQTAGQSEPQSEAKRQVKASGEGKDDGQTRIKGERTAKGESKDGAATSADTARVRPHCPTGSTTR